MNLTQITTINQLAIILGRGNDNFNNMLWVEVNGEVHLDSVINITPLAYANSLGIRLKFRYEVFAAGGEYTGQMLTDSDTFLINIYQSLLENWENGTSGVITDY